MIGGKWFAALAVLVAGVLAAPIGAGAAPAPRAKTGDWVESGFDAANTGFNASERILTTGNVGQLVASWNIAGATSSSPAIVGGSVFVDSPTAVNAYDVLTGALEWSFPIVASGFNASVAVANGVVYATGDVSSPSALYALDATTGHELWKLKLPSYSGFPIVVVDGVVYISDFTHTLYAVDVATHTVKWSYAGSSTLSRAAVENGRVYVTSEDGILTSLDEATGAFEWSYNLGGQSLEDPSVAKGIVYVGTRAGTVFAIDAAAGTLRWSFQAGDIYDTDVAIAKGTVYFSDHDTYIYALSAKSGALRWKFKTGKVSITDPVVANGVVYASSYDKYLYALDAKTGAKLWSFLAGGAPFDSLVVSNGNVFGGFPTGHLRRFTLPD